MSADYQILSDTSPSSPTFPAPGSGVSKDSSASLWSILTFDWMNDLLYLASHRSLIANDLPKLSYGATRLADRFLAKYKFLNRPKLTTVLNSLYGREYWTGCACEVAGEILQLTAPFALGGLLRFVSAAYSTGQDQQPSVFVGISWALLIPSMQLAAGILREQAYYRSNCAGAKARLALIGCIYRLGQSLSARDRLRYPISMLVNFLSTDISRLEDAAGVYYWRWTEPFSLLVVAVSLYAFLGSPCLGSFAILLLLIPLQRAINAKVYKLRGELQALTDRRAELTKESLSAMYLIKAFVWEKAILGRIKDVREAELAVLRRLKMLSVFNSGIAMSLPTFLAVASFSFVNMSTLPSEKIFGAMTLFSLLFRPIALLPYAYNSGAAVMLSLGRLQGLFETADDQEALANTTDTRDGRIVAKSLTCTWAATGTSDAFALRDVSFQIENKLVAVIGPLASGKSSLLNAILGNMEVANGQISPAGQIAYCPQNPWISSGTLRDGILFGARYDAERYRNVLRACALDKDLAELPNGDQTFIGESGVGLSGGQKARMQLARALYSTAPIVLLDDSLAALDAPTARWVFREAVQRLAFGRTVLFVTHDLKLLAQFDQILQVDEGSVAFYSSYDQWVASFDPATSNIHIQSTPAHVVSTNKKTEAEVAVPAVLYEEEDRATGTSFWRSLALFLSPSPDRLRTIAVVSTFCISVALQVLSAQWLVFWRQNSFAMSSANYIRVYALLAVCQSATYIIIAGLMLSIGLQASSYLYDKALQKVVTAPMTFHTTNPLGRVLSRLGKDVDIIDDQLVTLLMQQVSQSTQLVATIVLCAVIQPYLLFFLAGILIVFAYVARVFSPFNRDIKQLANVLRSNSYSQFAENLSGWQILRSFRATKHFEEAFDQAADGEAKAFFLTVANQRWLAIRLGAISCLSTLFVALAAVLQRHGIDPLQIGLALSAVLSAQNISEWNARNHLNISNALDSVRRLSFYTNIVAEDQKYKASRKPANGSLEFKNVHFRYRADTPQTLHSISFKIDAGTKLAICGRTGSGKTSLINALYRMSEIERGSILVDGQDNARLSLAEVRSQISLIPQEAVLLSGTIRFNLDPTRSFSDQELWQSLQAVGLWQSSDSRHEKGRFALDARVENGGQNFSIGEKALLSLARAFVKNSEIIVLDETTSALDSETDQFMMSAIDRIFKGKTRLMIAHRIQSTLRQDLVLVLHQGKVIEFGTPYDLWANAQGTYRAMCDASDISMG